MGLPPLIENTYPVRQRRFLEAYEAGAVDAHFHRSHADETCDFCGRPEGHGLHELPCPGGTTYHVGPDCLEAYNGLDASHIGDLRRKVRGTAASTPTLATTTATATATPATATAPATT
jgi:hypothetical protein